jgi:hypothetical protein
VVPLQGHHPVLVTTPTAYKQCIHTAGEHIGNLPTHDQESAKTNGHCPYGIYPSL